MAKLKADAIGQGQLTDFLENHSDFSFEVNVLNALAGLGFSCEHGGSYEDPVTKKPREFDIRATKDFGKRIIHLAVECKNLRENYPLLVSCVPRRDEEAFHEIAFSVHPDKVALRKPIPLSIPAMEPRSKTVRITGTRSFYPGGAPVGKSCEQVGVTVGGDITSSDSDVYAKWAQALSSAHDLTYEACRDGEKRTGDVCLSLVFPFLVVPDGRLWVVEFDAAGNRTCQPRQTDRCSYFVNLPYYHNCGLSGDKMTISHLEFLTVAGLREFVEQMCGNDDRLRDSFPVDDVLGALRLA